MYDVSGLHPLQQSLVMGSYVKMLMRRVLSDRYRMTYDKLQYQRVELDMAFQAYALYQISSVQLVAKRIEKYCNLINGNI